MRLARHSPVRLMLALAATAGGFLVTPAATTVAGAQTSAESDPSGSDSTETTTTLTYEAPHVSASHDVGAGEWSFVVEANKAVNSVRISVAGGDCGAGGQTLWETKVTDDELKAGAVARQAAFEEGLFCSHLLLDGTNKATATVTTSVPVKPDPVEPDPVEPDPDPYVSKEYERCSVPSDKDPYAAEVDHRVLAGAAGPDPEAPFIYQKYYPSTLQVHKGDLVEWCMYGAYDWHTITFLPGDMDVAAHPEATTERAGMWRWDETGQKAFGEGWLFGHEGGDVTKQCGRGPYFTSEAQKPCSLKGTDQWMSSSLWDRFFSTSKPGVFRSTIDLPPGTYRYLCNIHSSMQGFIEVLPEEQAPVNPSHRQIDDEIAADHAEAKKVVEELSDPSDSYDFATRRWTVRVGAETEDRSVSIEQFLPSRIDVRKGDTVHYVAGTDEPNTVTFPGGRQLENVQESNPQGGFSVTGRCNMHSCPTGRGAPWGMTGLAFIFNCDADDRASGVPGSLPYVPPATVARTNGAVTQTGCVAGGLPEMVTQPWYGNQQRAPGDLVVTNKTFHNSGTVLDEDLPDWYRTWPAAGALPGGTFPSTFDAKFPTDGTFKYFCAAHEFMNGVVVVKP